MYASHDGSTPSHSLQYTRVRGRQASTLSTINRGQVDRSLCTSPEPRSSSSLESEPESSSWTRIPLLPTREFTRGLSAFGRSCADLASPPVVVHGTARYLGRSSGLHQPFRDERDAQCLARVLGPDFGEGCLAILGLQVGGLHVVRRRGARIDGAGLLCQVALSRFGVRGPGGRGCGVALLGGIPKRCLELLRV